MTRTSKQANLCCSPPRHAVGPGGHASSVDAEVQKRLLNRLKRAEGQVRGVQRMIEEGRYCPDILGQLSALNESLRAAARELLRHHLEHCATEAIRSGDQQRARDAYEEITAIFTRYAR